MKSNRFTALFIILTLIATLFTAPATAYAAHKSPILSLDEKSDVFNLQTEAAGEENVKFIVEVEGDPLVTQSKSSALFSVQNTKTILDEQSKVMSEINKSISKSLTKGYVYTSVFNGFSIEGSMDMLDELKAIDGVKNVHISRQYTFIEPEQDTQATIRGNLSGELTSVTKAYESGFKGEGMVIAVVDAGCDTSHEFFAEAPVSPRYSSQDIDNMVKTLPLNSGALSSNQVYKNAKIPYAYNYMTNSADTYLHTQHHGTHVAGIATGKNGTAYDGTKFSGIAPEAQLVFFNCASVEGRFSDESVLAALNDAVLLDVDVINLSLGADYADPLCENIYTEVFSRCNEAGVAVVAANGNASRGFSNNTPYASNPDYSASGIPCGVSEATAVGSVDNFRYIYQGVHLESPDGTSYQASDGNSLNPIKDAFSETADDEYLEYVYCGYGKEEDFKELNLEGKIALVKRGEISFAEKGQNALDAGAVGLIVVNTSDDYIQMELYGIPNAIVTMSTGDKLIEQSDKRIKYNGVAYIESPVANVGEMSGYSSWGVNSGLELKPEISAPGGYIYSSVPDNKYDSLRGTSMAAPHMTGIMTLALQYYKTNPFHDDFNGKTGHEMVRLVENLAMNSASVIRRDDGVVYSPRWQGAGLVDMEGLLSSRVLLTGDTQKAKLSLRDGIYDTLNIEFDITNISKEDITFDDISIELVTDGYTESAGEYYVGDSVELEPLSIEMPESITVPSGEKQTFSAEVKLDSEFIEKNLKIFTNGFFVDGFVFLNSKADQTLKASLPFTGFCGDWEKATFLDSTIYDEGGSYLGFPLEEDYKGTYLFASSNDMSYVLGMNMVNQDIVEKEYISFSNNGYNNLGIMFTFMRGAIIDEASIEDEYGKKVFSSEHEYIMSKFRSVSLVVRPEGLTGLENNKRYNFVISGTLLGSENKTEKLSIPFVVDNTYPEIVSAVYDENLETITVKTRDNHYQACVAIEYTTDSGTEYDIKQVNEEDYDDQGYVTKTFDVSGVSDIGDIYVECYDYALNATYYKMEYFMDNIGAEITYLGQLKTMTQLDMNIKNNTSERIEANFIAAFYDDDNTLVSIDTEQVDAGAGEEYELSFSIFENTQNAPYLKLFVWSKDGIIPLDREKFFPIG